MQSSAYTEFQDVEASDILSRNRKWNLDNWDISLRSAEVYLPFILVMFWLDPLNIEASGLLGAVTTFVLALLPSTYLLLVTTPYFKRYEASKNTLVGRAAIAIGAFLAPASLRRRILVRMIKQHADHDRWLISLAANPATEEILFRSLETPLVNVQATQVLLQRARAGSLVEFLSVADENNISEQLNAARKMQVFACAFYLGLLVVKKEGDDRLRAEEIKSLEEDVSRQGVELDGMQSLVNRLQQLADDHQIDSHSLQLLQGMQDNIAGATDQLEELQTRLAQLKQSN